MTSNNDPATKEQCIESLYNYVKDKYRKIVDIKRIKKLIFVDPL